MTKTIRLATWNINSVRLRLDLIGKLVADKAPDILCLQETKVIDGSFPREALQEMGFVHQHFSGGKSYNGVAILSRVPFQKTGALHWCEQTDHRHIFVEMAGGAELHCVYIPAGGDIPDPKENTKFAHKLRFLDEMTSWWQGRPDDSKPKIMVGDFNIAPLEHDVWSHKQLLDVVSHTPIEVEKLGLLQASHNWVDAVRRFVPETEKLYSWWSYRASDWEASNRGRRLDHIWVTPDMAPKLKAHCIMREARGWQPKPSDHVPVMIDLEL